MQIYVSINNKWLLQLSATEFQRLKGLQRKKHQTKLKLKGE